MKRADTREFGSADHTRVERIAEVQVAAGTGVSKRIDGAIEVRGSDETVATKPRAISAVDEFDRSSVP
jgi:hypothetical protein